MSFALSSGVTRDVGGSGINDSSLSALSWGRGKELKQAHFPLTACNLLALHSLVHCSPHLSPAIFLCVTLFDQLVEPLKQAIKLAWHFRAPISELFSSTSTPDEALGIFRRTIRPTVFGNLFLLHYYFVYAEKDTGGRVEVVKIPNSLYLHSGARWLSPHSYPLHLGSFINYIFRTYNRVGDATFGEVNVLF